LVWRPESKRPLGRPMRGWEDNIKMDLGEIWKAMTIKHLHLSDYPKQEIHHTDFYLCGLQYRFFKHVLISPTVLFP
jgi:hypothetical protein